MNAVYVLDADCKNEPSGKYIPDPPAAVLAILTLPYMLAVPNIAAALTTPVAELVPMPMLVVNALVPCTCKSNPVCIVDVPIPTLPEESIRIRSAESVPKISGDEPLVPIKPAERF